MADTERTPLNGLRCFWGIVLLGLCLFMALSLFSYRFQDVSLLQSPPNSPPNNLIGPLGAWMGFVVFMLFGVGGYLVPLWCFLIGVLLLLNREAIIGYRLVWSVVLLVTSVAFMELVDGLEPACRELNILHPGGLYGWVLVQGVFIRWLSPVGTGIVMGTLWMASLIMVLGVGNLVRFHYLVRDGFRALQERIRISRLERQGRREQIEQESRELERQRRRLERTIRRQDVPESVPSAAGKGKYVPGEVPPSRPGTGTRSGDQPATPSRTEPEVPRPVATPPVPRKRPEPEPVPVPVSRPDATTVPAVALGTETAGHDGVPQPLVLPPLSLLKELAVSGDDGISADTGTTGRILVETLSEFGIESEVTNVEQGPTVTRYELTPAPGVRVERISGLSNNLALALKATSVRVQAPVPGKGVVGIEVPNALARKVYLREILESERWQSGKVKVPLALGKDVGGADLVADLADMPHLLVAGSTGSGKTVCINSILAGMLMARTPDQLRLLLVDPKIVEFSVYNELPHLVIPVVTDPKKVALALRWAINEMERRYKLFARVGVRNIESYNHREVAVQTSLFNDNEEGGDTPAASEKAPPQTVPYIVIVIDELADLMLADQAEIENCIARLAQLSRAVGIHMILSTQRPSVNVITGTIKANFPARIAFQVAQKVDSRTILDTAGADKLLGRGDMLFLPPGSSKLVRAQGAMTTDEDIRAIVNYIKAQATPSYELEIKEKIERPASGVDDGEDDDVLAQAIEIIRETRRASTSSLQRRLRIGYTRAARVMDILEERGIIGPPRGSDPREILIDLDGDIPDNNGNSEPEVQNEAG
ncbi:MAG: hypothetical protein A2498_11840 [Lentisphaerae bacterium RIFOXYC12_FULL_60_16]|nr:MAG: hypothetical protein A2498_11840 [Lentisphaerae bacterium RIFOXYC12_FULL_60_16]OGV72588.1 MAG: hypothetical protein A2269_01165 [Lentisphaerae bacterium RIFOXYA12_FULL_60_10]OGV77290.1 MAG: hypothetical protein A2340_06185 [Lentisphaerae bacterium RIFOXYB12_FULL_60_10]